MIQKDKINCEFPILKMIKWTYICLLLNELLIVIFSSETLVKFLYRFNAPQYHLVNIAIFMVPVLIIYLFTQRVFFSVLLSALFLFLLGAIHSIKYNLNEEPLYGWDWGLADEAFNVIFLNIFDLDVIFLIAISLILPVWLVIVFIKENKCRYSRIKTFAILLLFSITSVLSVKHAPFGINDIKVQYSKHSRNNAHKSKGFLYALVVGFFNPHQDSELLKQQYVKSIGNLLKKYNSKLHNTVSKKPNIIFYMSESLQDLSLYGVKFKNDPLPFLHSLSDNGHYSGELIVSTFGGMSSKTEFEALTGFPINNSYYPNTFTPYIGYKEREIVSIPNILKNHGYKTLISVASDKENFNRHRITKFLGFDKYISITDDIPIYKKIFGRVSDENLLDVTKEFMNKNNESPMFLNLFTDSTHGSYYRINGLQKFIPNHPGLTTDNIDVTMQYATAINHADNSIGALVKYLSGLKRPSILFIYGDHRPGLRGVYPQIKIDNPEADYNISMYKTPLYIWSSEKIDVEVPKQISANFLGYYALKAIGFDRFPAQYDFLDKIHRKINALSKFIVDDKGSVFANNNNAYKDISFDYAILKYDAMDGDNLFHKQIFEK